MAQGIPTSLRGAVWPLLIGNRLGVTETLYEQSKKEAFRIKQLSLDREAAVEAAREKTVRFAAEMAMEQTDVVVSASEVEEAHGATGTTTTTTTVSSNSEDECDVENTTERTNGELTAAAAVSIADVDLAVDGGAEGGVPPSAAAGDFVDEQCYDESLDVDGNRMDTVQADGMLHCSVFQLLLCRC